MKRNRILFTVIYVALAFLLILDLSLGICLLGMRETKQSTGGVILDPNASDERPGGTQAPSQNVTVAGFSQLTIPPDIDTVAIDLYNPIENNGLFYMTFELRLLGESEEVLFQTGYVAPGKHIYQVTLAHGLPEGEYTARLLIQPYRMSDLTPTNNVSATVALIVK